MSGERRQPDRLGEALRALARARRERRPEPPRDLEARLAALERDVQEVRSRVNALFFTVIAVAVGDFVGRLVVP
jgi:hypothetical protein